MKSLLLKVMIFLSFILLALFILNTHYVEIGECAAIVFYKPLTITDRCIFIVIAFVGMLASLLICKQKKKVIFILGGIYLVIALGLCAFGNQILEMRTIHWPHDYQPLNIEKHRKKSNLIGCWLLLNERDTNSFLDSKILFTEDNLMKVCSKSPIYTYNISKDTLFIHKPNHALQKYKINVLTKSRMQLELI